MSELNVPITFSALLGKCHRIVIPRIQRDYAQGRDSEKEVRDAFLDTLQTALGLPAGHESLPLNLDFIYGSRENDGTDAPFLPLDGQQRLTTLFLLHWYLAWQDGQLDEFRGLIWDGRHSRFSYDVRPTSGDFFDALVQFSPTVRPGELTSVKTLLEDQPWYFLYWRLDPTIQSALTMLDAIHERFREAAGSYARLVDREQPAITFQLLQLEHFGLSDDLYIKMNARGKPLTAFETFKARFEELLGTLFQVERRAVGDAELSVPQFFELRMDTQWTDFFWHYKNPATNTFDDAVMNLVWALIRISLDPANSSFVEHTARLRNRQLSATYTAFQERGWLNRTLSENLICLLEVWSAGGGALVRQLPSSQYFDEADFFRKAITNPAGLDYSELAQFAAFIAYLKRNEGETEAAEIHEWMRVVSNLVRNSNIERPEEFGRALVGLQKLSQNGRRILQHLAESTVEVPGLSAQQLREEILKARLILAHPGWRGRIDRAEQHGYFRGQIEFLLEFSGATTRASETPVSDWADEGHAEVQAQFDDFLAKAEQTFGADGLIEFSGHPHLWQRALLTVGDYLIQGSSNYSFGTDPAGNWDSWKRFLRGNPVGPSTKRLLIKSLWHRLELDSPIADQLEVLVRDFAGAEPWREAMVKYPQVIEYCEQREIRRRDGVQEIYLLKRKQMNGAHAELFSFVLYQQMLSKAGQASIAPLRLMDYQPVSMTEIEPSARFVVQHSRGSLVFHVESIGGRFRVRTTRAALAGFAEADAELMGELGFTQAGDTLSRFSSRDEIQNTLQSIGMALAGLGSLGREDPSL